MEEGRKHRGLVRIYLDLETYRPVKEGSFTREDIILIGLLVDGSEVMYEPLENFELEDVKRFDEEREILLRFYKYLKKILREGYSIEIIGFNNLRFDIPLIVSKTLRHNIVKDVFGSELKEERRITGRYVHSADFINKWWHSIYTIDLAQVLLSFNMFRFKELKLETMAKRLNEKFKCKIEVQEKFNLGGENIAELFKNGRFEEIEKKNIADLRVIRDIYQCLKKICTIAHF
ncbi:MAG: hypothetical protein QXP29_07805 [Candidatus Nezhaarchaeales archaeon]